MSDTVPIADSGPLRTITLNRPDKLNAFNEEMHIALRAALQAASDTKDVRAVLLTGAGRGFCAGQDLGDRDSKKGDVPDLGDTLNNFFNPNVRLIRDMPKPVIAAVNGAAAGAGANIALSCDIVLAAKSAKFLQAFARIGLIPDAGGSWTLPQLVGPARARGLRCGCYSEHCCSDSREETRRRRPVTSRWLRSMPEARGLRLRRA